jgi:hypothetical protein
MDHFAEYMVEKQPSSQDRAKRGGILVAAVLLVGITAGLAFWTGWLVILLVTALIIYGAYYLLTGCRVEYEYSITNGEFDVEKIIGKRKRVHLLTVQVSNWTAFGAYTDDTPELENATLFLCSDNTGVDAYYADMETEEYGKARLIFTPNDEMIETVSIFLPAALRRKQ